MTCDLVFCESSVDLQCVVLVFFVTILLRFAGLSMYMELKERLFLIYSYSYIMIYNHVELLLFASLTTRERT